MNEFEKKIAERFHIEFHEDDVFWNNEVKANLFVRFMLDIMCGVLILMWILGSVEVLKIPMKQMTYAVAINAPLLLLGSLLCRQYNGKKHWLKYAMCVIALCASTALTTEMNTFASITIALPMLISVRYYRTDLTRLVAGMSVFAMAISEYLRARFGVLNLNLVTNINATTLTLGSGGLREAVWNAGVDRHEYMKNLFRGSFGPRLLMLLIIAMVCIELAKRAHENVKAQDEISRRTEALNKEMQLATAIQQAVLPKQESHRKEVDISAMMLPAKEVGGDFYDFFAIDSDHMGMVIGDVSGKGIPAALMMMMGKTLIKTGLCEGHSPKETAELVNGVLAKDNENEIFMTAWIGVLELSTGKLTGVDAGHEQPAIRKASGAFELYKDKKCFVLGGLEGVIYTEMEWQLEKGDVLFMYTDGVTEAKRSDETMLGTERMLEELNAFEDTAPKALLKHMHERIEAFVGDAEPFDDLTMLCARYNGTD